MGFLKKKREEGNVLRIAAERIAPSPYQPRVVFEEGALASLAESIRRYGILQPISVRTEGDGYQIIAGERRYRAALLAGMKEIPCLVYTADGETCAELAVMENLLREDLNMFETASAMERLFREYGLTQEQIAERLSVSQSYVANKLRLLRFDPAMREKILGGGLTERHARALLRLPSTMWEEMADKILARQANVATAEKMIEEALSAQGRPKKKPRTRVRGAARDVRLLYNSVDRAVEMAKRCGIAVHTKREESEGEIRLILSIPKSG